MSNEEIFWCKTCLNMSTRNRIEFDENGRCNACVWSEEKITLDWTKREAEFLKIVERTKKLSKGDYDVIVPVSGGKDGSYVSWILSNKYNLRVLNVTINPPLRSSIGHKNLENFKKGGLPLIEVNVPYEVSRKLNKTGFVEQGRPLYGWTASIFTSVIRIAKEFGVNLIMYGEDGEIEYGGSTESKSKASFSAEFIKRVYLEGQLDEAFTGLQDHEKYWWNFEFGDISNIELAHWSYFENWDPYRNYLIAKEHYGLTEREESNTGTYTNFSQNDNMLYDLHTYLMYIKFGFGRATQDVGIDVRRGSLTRDQGINLAELYDNHFPVDFLEEYLEYYQMSEKEFYDVIDKFANKKLFRKEGNNWVPIFTIK
jgi:N-acetyl sugar amidotransferase